MPSSQLSGDTAISDREIETLILADPDPIVALMVYLYDTIPLSAPQQDNRGSEDSAS
jgi:hypothetical protein